MHPLQLARDRYPAEIAHFLGEMFQERAMASGAGGTQAEMALCEPEEIPLRGLGDRDTRWY